MSGAREGERGGAVAKGKFKAEPSTRNKEQRGPLILRPDEICALITMALSIHGLINITSKLIEEKLFDT